MLDWLLKAYVSILELDISEKLAIMAFVTGPFIGIYAQKRLERNAERKAKQLHIFRVLMATRSTPVAADHVISLNLIVVDFSNKKRKEKPVIDAWGTLLCHLNTGYPNYDTDKDKPEYPQEIDIAIKKSKEYLEDLLYEMSKCLGYGLKRDIIKDNTYYSGSQVDKDNDDFLIRKALKDVLHGRPLGVDVKSFIEQPPNEAE